MLGSIQFISAIAGLLHYETKRVLTHIWPVMDTISLNGILNLTPMARCHPF